MKSVLTGLLFMIGCVSCCDKATAQGGASHFAPDSAALEIGVDLFFNAEFYGLHLSGQGSLTDAGGIGAELRLAPVFINIVEGVTGDDGVPGTWRRNSVFLFTSLCAGAVIDKYRIEIGGMEAGTWVDTPPSSYTCLLAGISRRYGTTFFVQPEVKIMVPIVSNCISTQHYRLDDLFFAFSFKVGIGGN